MKLLLIQLIFILCLASCSVDRSLPNDVALYESKTNFTQENFQKILIAGTGSSEIRFFVENLSEEMIKEFKQRGIEAKFYFVNIGSDNDERYLMEKMQRENFDGCMLFFQKDLLNRTIINGRKNKADLPDPKREQLIEIKLFHQSGLAGTIWDANIKVDINPTDKSVYSNISSIIFKRLKQNKIVG